MKTWISTIALALSLVASTAQADWHGGKVTQINITYDGNTMTFVVSGWVRTNCAC